MQPPFIDIHTHKTGRGEINLPSVRIGTDAVPDTPFFSAGIHPWDAAAAREEWLAEIEHLHPAAIGETGLDFATSIDRAVQEKWFVRQLDTAQRMRLPVVIHCVKAYNELMVMLREYTSGAHGAAPLVPIIHGFTGSTQTAESLTRIGCYLSFGETLLHSPKTKEALRTVPSGRIFLETDESPLSIEDLYSEAAKIRECSIEELKENIYGNFKKIFPKL